MIAVYASDPPSPVGPATLATGRLATPYPGGSSTRWTAPASPGAPAATRTPGPGGRARKLTDGPGRPVYPRAAERSAARPPEGGTAGGGLRNIGREERGR